jgi:outer membrane protein OmpA-like peptidoglycan-associated protein
MRARVAGLGVLALGAAWGCASTPDPTVQAVRQEYQQVSTDSAVAQYAPLALDEARQAVNRLERAERQDAEREELNHLAYVARVHFDIARAEAGEVALQERVKKLGEERDRMLLEARSTEADRARSEAERLRAELAMREARRAEEERRRSEQALEQAQRQTDVAAQDAEQSRLALQQQQAESARVQAELEQKRAEAERMQQELERQRAAAERARERAEELRSEFVAQLQTRETSQGIVLTMGGVLFATDRDTLLPGARRLVGRVAQYLNEFPDRPIEVAGHTDSVGSDEYNQGLSERRAESVAELLRDEGVAAERIRARGYGESQPVAPNTNLAGRQQNRRVEIVLLNAPVAAPAPAGDVTGGSD